MTDATGRGPVLRSKLDTRSDDYRSNLDAMAALWAQVEEQLASVPSIGGQRYVDRHRARGKMLVRERIEALVDPNSAFLELSPLAAWGTQDPIGAGTVCGIGVVEGVEVRDQRHRHDLPRRIDESDDVTKSARLYEIIRRNRLPLITLTESAGADLPKQAEIFVPGGAGFRNLTQLSQTGIPTITLGVRLVDRRRRVRPGHERLRGDGEGPRQVFLGGPPLVKMAIGEDADEETLGGAEMHSRTRAVGLPGGRRARRDPHRPRDRAPPRLAQARPRPARSRRAAAVRPRGAARHRVGRRAGAVRRARGHRPRGRRQPVRRVQAALREPAGLRLGARSAAIPVGILANNGILFSEASQKGAQFIQLCNQSDIPLLFLQNITGFMVGTKYEQGGIIKHGAKLINAVSNSTVPHITMMVGASATAPATTPCRAAPTIRGSCSPGRTTASR